MELTPELLTQLELTVRIVAGVSLFAVICIFFDLKRSWPKMRKSPSRIILWWTIATSTGIPAMMLGRLFVPQSADEQPSPMCLIQGTVLSFGLFSSICWAACIASHLLIAIKWKFDVKVLLNAERTYHILCWGLPALTCCILLFLPNAYGDGLFWCWIDARYDWLRVLLLNVPSLLTIGFSLISYVLVAREINHTFRHSSLKHSHAEGNYLEVQKRRIQATNRFAIKCSLYLLAFILAHSGEVANYILSLCSIEPQYFVYEWLAVTIPGAGFFIAIAYFSTRFVNPPKGACVSGGSFYSGGTKLASPLGHSLVRSVDGNSGKSLRSVLSDRGILSESPITGSSRGSVVPTIASTPTSNFQFNEFRNSAIMPSVPPSAYLTA